VLARVDNGYSVVGSQQGVEGQVQLLILAGEDLIQFLNDRRKILLDGVPEDREIYAEILVNGISSMRSRHSLGGMDGLS